MNSAHFSFALKLFLFFSGNSSEKPPLKNIHIYIYIYNNAIIIIFCTMMHNSRWKKNEKSSNGRESVQWRMWKWKIIRFHVLDSSFSSFQVNFPPLVEKCYAHCTISTEESEMNEILMKKKTFLGKNKKITKKIKK